MAGQVMGANRPVEFDSTHYRAEKKGFDLENPANSCGPKFDSADRFV